MRSDQPLLDFNVIAVTQARAANPFSLCATVVTAFQVALVLGAPWGALTLGGRYPGTLPPSARVIAALSATLLVAFIVIMRMRAGLRRPAPRTRSGAL